MSPTLTAPDPATFPADVLAFAAERGVTDYLMPLYELTRRHFPAANIKVRLELDYEIAGLAWIVYVAEAINPDYESARVLKDAWRKAVISNLPPDARQPFGPDVR